MTFLTPLFLLGGAALALPILFHLIRRTTRKRSVFSSLLFLSPSPPRLTRRSRLENLLLLVLRCLVLALLVLGFARPFWKRTLAAEPGRGGVERLVLLLDTSASMQRANLWAEARKQAEDLVARGVAGDLALYTFGRALKPVITFDEWRSTPLGEREALARGRLAGLTPQWDAGQMGAAVIGAVEALTEAAESGQARGRVVLISDLQEGSRVELLQGYEWPQGIHLALAPVKTREAANASMQILASSEADARERVVPVRIYNAGGRQEQFQVGWSRAGSFVETPAVVYVAPGGNRVLRLRVGDQADTVQLRGDAEAFDNRAWVVLPQPVQRSVLYIGETVRDTRQPRYFLEHAFQQTPWQQVKVLAQKPGALDLSAAGNLIVVADSVSEAEAGEIRAQASRGKTVLAVVRSPAMARTVASLVGMEPLAIEEANPAQYAMLANIDFGHPLFAPFADPKYSDFTKIRFWKYRRVDFEGVPGVRRLAVFDSGDAALVEVPVGAGRVLVWTSGWQPEDSQFALSTKFVPFMFGVLDETGSGLGAPRQYRVGDSVPLNIAGKGLKGGAVSVRRPDGREVRVEEGQTQFTETESPGIYEVIGAQPARFAVNLDPAESRVGTLGADEFEALGVPLEKERGQSAKVAAANHAKLAGVEQERRQKLWRWLLVGSIGFLLVETWLSGRGMSRATAASGGTG